MAAAAGDDPVPDTGKIAKIGGEHLIVDRMIDGVATGVEIAAGQIAHRTSGPQRLCRDAIGQTVADLQRAFGYVPHAEIGHVHVAERIEHAAEHGLRDDRLARFR